MSAIKRFDRSLGKRGLCLLSVAAACTAAACRSDAVTCAGVPELGIQVQVRDASTQASLDESARVTVSRLTAPFDSMSGTPRIAVIITSSSPGTYRVRVEVPGYVTSSQVVNVPTSTRQCAYVEPQNIVVALARSGA